MSFVVNLWYHDRSGIVQSFGPYDDESTANDVVSRLSKWPAIRNNDPNNWEVKPLIHTTGSPGGDAQAEAGWTPEIAADVKKRFAAGEACQHCRGLHSRACPRVKTMAFHPNGSLATIEFWPDGQWSDANVIWPDEVPHLETPND